MLDELENIREGEAADTASPKRPCRRPKLPNRIAKDSSRKDPQLDILSDGAERLYWRLILAADDFGRFEADPRIVKADCFPLKIDSLRTATVEKWLDEIEKAGLVKFYSVLNRGYGQFITFDPPRAAKSKFPAPNDAEITSTENKGDSICKQMIADAPVFDVRIRSSYSDAKFDNTSPPPEEVWPSAAALLKLYNEKTPDELPAAETLSPSRVKKSNEALKIFPKQEYWEEVFGQFHRSRFLRGLAKNGNGHENFRADYDWLLSKGKDGVENFVKIREGKYRD